MARFSERYGYVKPNDVIIRECITEPIQNSICNVLSRIRKELGEEYRGLEIALWKFYLNKKIDNFIYRDYYDEIDLITEYIENEHLKWYYKLDIIEFLYPYIAKKLDKESFLRIKDELNKEFKRHNFAYRLVNGKIVEITSDNEIKSIEEAINTTKSNARTHLQNALEKLSPSNSDYRNSIKESISAVECVCREITGESTLDKSLKKLENKGIVLNSQLKTGLGNLYQYTNDGSTGIRHALMDDKNAPTADEAIFMLVSCSAFVNYLIKKKS